MKNLKRIALAGGIIASLGMVAAPAATAQSSQLTPAEQQQWQEDPFGAAVWGSIKGSTDLARGTDAGAWTIASYYSTLDPNAAYPGAFAKLDACVKGIAGPQAPEAVRLHVAHGCLLTNQALKDAILAEAPGFH